MKAAPGHPDSSGDYVFGENSHGVMMSASPPPNSTSFSGLRDYEDPFPREDRLGRIVCPTCHDPHLNDHPPFLRKDINILCASCHGKRQWKEFRWQQGNRAQIGTFGIWGHQYLGAHNPGSHPVGVDISGHLTAGGFPVTIPRSMRVPFATEPGKWSLGGHLSEGDHGAITCVTCHAVHGVKKNEEEGSPGDAADDCLPTPNMLVIPQGTMLDPATGRRIANGAGGSSALCEGCHQGALAAEYGVAGAGSKTGRIFPNPGSTLFGHPVDGMRTLGDRLPNGPGWAGSAANWPVGGATGGSASRPNLVCGTCHAAHPAAARGRFDLGTAPGKWSTTGYLLRAPSGRLCPTCHPNSPAAPAHGWKERGKAPIAR
jgi:predicted CXXCH cytochrome family protein